MVRETTYIEDHLQNLVMKREEEKNLPYEGLPLKLDSRKRPVRHSLDHAIQKVQLPLQRIMAQR